MTSADPIYVLEILDNDQKDPVLFSKYLNEEIQLEREFIEPFLKGKTIARYMQPDYDHMLLFPYRSGKLVSWAELKSAGSKTADYLERCRESLSSREKGKMAHARWFGYVYPKNLTKFHCDKLIVQVISKYSRYTLDSHSLYFTGGGNGPYYGLLVRNNFETKYILGILNSPVSDFYIQQVSSPFRGGYWSFGKRFIEKIPIRSIDFNNSNDNALHDRMVGLVEDMLVLHKKLAAATIPADRILFHRQIDATDLQINALVYELYELTDNEIRIVEGNGNA